MGFIAEFCVEIPHLSQATSAVPEMRVSGDDVVLEDDYPRKCVFTAHGGSFDEFETALDEDPTVAEYTVLTKLEKTTHYIVTYDMAMEAQGIYHVAVEQDIVYLTFEMQDGEYFVRVRVPHREALATLREYCRANDIPFRLKRIYEEGPSAAGGYGLTDAQRTALQRAYELGYFDSPRTVTLDVIGDDLGISRQAVANRLRRGHNRLIEATIA